MDIFWIAVAFGFGLLCRHIGLPSLVGFLLSGFAMSAYGYETVPIIEYFAHIGILLLLFTVGLKIRIRSILGPQILGVSLIHLIISAIIMGPVLVTFSGLTLGHALPLAIALGLSSTVVAAKILDAKKELRAFHGRIAIGILIIQDLAAVGILSVMSDHSPSPYSVALIALPLTRPLLYKILDLSGHDELLVLFGLVLALVLGGIAFDLLGLSSELGALVMGALLAGHKSSKELADAMWGLREIFLIVFFLQIGLIGVPDWSTFIIVFCLLLFLPIKAALFFFILLRFRMRARSSFLACLSLASYSEFGLVVVHLGAESGWLGPEWVVLTAVTVALSFVIVAPLNRVAHIIYQRHETFLCQFEIAAKHSDDEPISLGSAHILIMGMGRVGTSAYDFLTNRNERVVGLDSDLDKVEHQLRGGRRVLYADAEDPGFWNKLRLDGIRAVLLAMPDLEAKELATTQLRHTGYKGLIATTAMFPEQAKSIRELGCDLTPNYHHEIGVGIAEHTWEALYPEGRSQNSSPK